MARAYSSRQPTYSTSARRGRPSSSRRARTVGAAPRKRRGPAPVVIIAVVLAAIVLLWVLGKGCGGSQQAQENDRLRTYATAANKPIEMSASIAGQFSTLANSIRSTAKNDVDTKLTQMAKDCKSVAQTSAKIKVPLKAADLQPLAQLAYNLRTQGVKEYQTGIMGVLNNTDRAAATASVSKSLTDLVVSDQVLQNYRSALQARLTAAKAGTQVGDPGLFVASVDSASSTAVNAYVLSIANPSSTTKSTAANPSDAIKAYYRAKGVDYSSMSFSVASTSSSDESWKIDAASESGGTPTYFLLHGSNGTWTVVDSGTTFTVEKLKSDGAPADLKPPVATGT
jgi:hypothetical protein